MERMRGADALMLYLDRAEAYNHTIKLQIIDPRRIRKAGRGAGSRRRGRPASASCRGSGSATCACRWASIIPSGWTTPRSTSTITCDGSAARRRARMVELCELICELYAHPLDHSRPLWQVWVIEGLEGGQVGSAAADPSRADGRHRHPADAEQLLADQARGARASGAGGVAPCPAALEVAPAPRRPARPAGCRCRQPAGRDPRLARRPPHRGRLAPRRPKPLPPTPGDPHYPAPYATRLSPRRTFAIALVSAGADPGGSASRSA